MTRLEACRLIEELNTHAHWHANRALAAAVTQQLQADNSGIDVSSLLAQMQVRDGLAPDDAPLRRRYAEAVRVALRAVHRNDVDLAALPQLRWHEPQGLLVGAAHVPIADVFNAAAQALEDRTTPIATVDALAQQRQQRLSELDRQAVVQAVGYVMVCLSRRAEGGDEDGAVEPKDVACERATELLPEWVWSIDDEFSPFGNDCGWDWLQRIVQPRHAPGTIESEVLADLAAEWEFSGGLPARGTPDARDIDIAQALIAAAFASLVLWAAVTPKLRGEAIRAAKLLSRAAQVVALGAAPRCTEMATLLAAAPSAG